MRQEAFSQILSSYSNGNSLNSSIKHLVKVEEEVTRYYKSKIPYSENKVLYFGVILIIYACFAFATTVFILQKKVFVPLKDVGQKMTDFLNEKYTYQFSVPTSDEIGSLQKNFNAMAQKVLMQMEELKTLDKAKTEFLNIASHELRTPLTSIKGSLTLLLTGVAGEQNDVAKNLMKYC